MESSALCNVHLELTLEFGVEDRDHLSGGESVPARRPQVQRPVQVDDGGAAVGDVRLTVGVGPVEVGKDLPAT